MNVHHILVRNDAELEATVAEYELQIPDEFVGKIKERSMYLKPSGDLDIYVVHYYEHAMPMTAVMNVMDGLTQRLTEEFITQQLEAIRSTLVPVTQLN